jgi:hypothetical protein
VKDGAILPHHGQLLEGGAIIDLPRHVGTDPAVCGFVDEIDDAGDPVGGYPIGYEEHLVVLDRFQPHERVTLIRDRMVRERALLERLELDLAEEEATAAAQPAAVDIDEES